MVSTAPKTRTFFLDFREVKNGKGFEYGFDLFRVQRNSFQGKEA